MTTDRLRRIPSLLPTTPGSTGATESQPATTIPVPPAGDGEGRPSRLAALDAMARERARLAAQVTEEAEQLPAEPAPAPGQDPYLAFALRWWWLLVLGALIGGLAAFAYTRYGPMPFASIAQVQVPAVTTTDPTANSSQARSAATNYAAEATSPQMFALVSKELDGTLSISANELQLMNQEGRLKVALVKNTNLISITVTDPEPERARLLANTVALVFVRDVNNRAATTLDTRGLQLQEQIKVTESRLVVAELQQRERDLQDALVAQRGLLLQLQLGYQQELQRQVEADRLAAIAGQPVTPQIIETRNQWLKLIQDQIVAMQTTLNDLTGKLKAVQDSLKALPAASDPSVSTAFTGAYKDQLESLTREFAQIQLSGQAAREPLVLYGTASDPLASSGQKKMLLMGLAAGIGFAVGLGFLIDLLRQRRGGDQTARKSAPVSEHQTEQPMADPLPEVIATQRSPDLVPLPMHPRTPASDVRWRRAIGE